MKVSHGRLLDLLDYAPASGLFYDKCGSVVGCRIGHGYLGVQIEKRQYRSHILAWFYMTGEWPKNQIDHENRIRDDNRWENLREATKSLNAANAKRPVTNTSGFKGASWDKSKRKYQATICTRGKRLHLGRFDTVEEAHAAYLAAARKHFGEFAYGG